MLYTIYKIEKADNSFIVTGETSCGNIKGIWKSKDEPVSGKSYNIEISFGLKTASVSRDDILIDNKRTESAVSIRDGKNFFAVLCEDIDEIYYIRFSFDGLAMLDIENDDHTIRKGDFLTFLLPFDEVGIYPY